MVFMHIDRKNCMDGKCDLVAKLDSYLGNKHTKTFLLIFMEGCGPCNATRPEWSKLNNVFSNSFLKRKDIVIAAIDYTLAEKLANLKTKPTGFPTMKFICNQQEENYEDCSISKKDRTIDSFVEWIHLKCGNTPKMHNKTLKHNKTHNKSKTYNKTHNKTYNKSKKYNMSGGKWSLKYKRSINCKKPKGFSQKQHCKYGRK